MLITIGILVWLMISHNKGGAVALQFLTVYETPRSQRRHCKIRICRGATIFFSFWCDTVSVQTDGRKHRFLPLVNPFLSDVFAFNQNLGEFNQTLDYSSEAQIGVSLSAWQFGHLRGCCKTLQPFLTRIVIHGRAG